MPPVPMKPMRNFLPISIAPSWLFHLILTLTQISVNYLLAVLIPRHPHDQIRMAAGLPVVNLCIKIKASAAWGPSARRKPLF